MPTTTTVELDLAAIRRAGAKRARALRVADEELDAIVDEVARVERAGGQPNIAQAARIAGVARTSIYDRLAKRQED